MDAVEQARKISQHDNDIAAIYDILTDHTARLDDLAQQVRKHGTILDRHTAVLDQHTAVLDQHTAVLDQHTAKLDQVDRKLDLVLERLP